MSNGLIEGSQSTCHDAITPHHLAPPVDIPRDHVGMVVLPGTGRQVWWTGRVAIGLRHQPPSRCEIVTQSSLWLQKLMLGLRTDAKRASRRRS